MVFLVILVPRQMHLLLSPEHALPACQLAYLKILAAASPYAGAPELVGTDDEELQIGERRQRYWEATLCTAALAQFTAMLCRLIMYLRAVECHNLRSAEHFDARVTFISCSVCPKTVCLASMHRVHRTG